MPNNHALNGGGVSRLQSARLVTAVAEHGSFSRSSYHARAAVTQRSSLRALRSLRDKKDRAGAEGAEKPVAASAYFNFECSRRN
jgi:hypothetical protein